MQGLGCDDEIDSKDLVVSFNPHLKTKQQFLYLIFGGQKVGKTTFIHTYIGKKSGSFNDLLESQ